MQKAKPPKPSPPVIEARVISLLILAFLCSLIFSSDVKAQTVHELPPEENNIWCALTLTKYAVCAAAVIVFADVYNNGLDSKPGQMAQWLHQNRPVGVAYTQENCRGAGTAVYADTATSRFAIRVEDLHNFNGRFGSFYLYSDGFCQNVS